MERADPAFSRHVDGLWGGADALPTLIEASEAVESLLSSPGWSVLQSVIGAEIVLIDRELEGRAKEAAEYARVLGRRSALRAPESAARAVMEVAARRREQAERHERVAAESAAQEETV